MSLTHHQRYKNKFYMCFSTKVNEVICDEIGDVKFCLIVDEARNKSIKEQMAIVLRFVDNNGFVRERFFDLVHVFDTAASTLKKCIYSVLSKHQLDIQNIRRQRYNSASNMRGGGGGMSCKLWFQMIVHMPTTFIASHISCNWH
jgi:hypothetical protein